jgi:hypothetical protein
LARSGLPLRSDDRTTLNDIEHRITEVRELRKSQNLTVAIDDCQRLGDIGASLDTRLPLVVEKLRDLTMSLDVPMLATWPDLDPSQAPQRWAEKIAGGDIIMVMREDTERSRQLSEPNRAIALHIVKNHAGEKGILRFDFLPPLATFTEHDSHA